MTHLTPARLAAVPDAVRRCVAVLHAAGYAAYPVGGCVRDLLLARVPSDWDVATAARPETVQALFDRTLPTGLRHGTVTVLLDGAHIEVTTFRGEGDYSDGRHPDAVTFGVDLTQDLARRDFTVNAMALDVQGAAVIDPFGGQCDLAARRIRAVGDADRRFAEDALRMFRAVRFAAQLGFSLDDSVGRAIGRMAPRCALLSGERIKAEVEKTLLSPHPELVGLLLDYRLLPLPAPPERDGPSWVERLDGLRAAAPTPAERWRAFCRRTGFDLTTLPVERALKAAVLHPERALVNTLALSSAQLMALGFSGEGLGRAQTALARHILDHPEDNTPAALTALADELPRT